ncbi:MAG: hypothetical protein KJ621_14585, partial [Proteobacteria bacterium]|nr:hypothetical protein [Pseudomonadota bacterium]
RVPPVNFYRAIQGRQPSAIAGAAALTFMGARLDSWPEVHRRGLEALFSRVAYKATAEWKEEIVQFDPEKGTSGAEGDAPAAAVFPDGTPARLSPDRDPRQVFADWLITPENPWFTRNIANLQLNAIGQLIRENLTAFKKILESPAWKKIVPDVAKTVASLKRSARRLESMIGQADHPTDLAKVRRNIVAITTSARAIAATLEGQLKQIQLAKTVKRLDRVVRLQAKSLGQLVGSAKKLVDDLRAELAAIRYAVRRSSGNLSRATADLKQLIHKLKTQPSQLLFGKPPPERFPRGNTR